MIRLILMLSWLTAVIYSEFKLTGIVAQLFYTNDRPLAVLLLLMIVGGALLLTRPVVLWGLRPVVEERFGFKLQED